MALDEARRSDVGLPSASAAASTLEKARQLGYDERDIAALREVLAKAGDQPPPR